MKLITHGCLWWPFAVVLLIAGCEPDAARLAAERDAVADTLIVSGTLTYRERVMLPAGVRVELAIRPLHDPDASAVADTSFFTGEQIPIDFELHVPAMVIDTTIAYGLTARLVPQDLRLRWSTPHPMPVLTLDAPSEVEVVLFADEPSPETPAVEPWLEARQRGVSFRALGQEPGWVADLYGTRRSPTRLHLSLDYGERQYDLQDVVQDTDGEGNLMYRATGDDVTVEVTIEDRQCADPMSGEIFEALVTVRLDGETFTGCGRSLS